MVFWSQRMLELSRGSRRSMFEFTAADDMWIFVKGVYVWHLRGAEAARLPNLSSQDASAIHAFWQASAFTQAGSVWNRIFTAINENAVDYETIAAEMRNLDFPGAIAAVADVSSVARNASEVASRRRRRADGESAALPPPRRQRSSRQYSRVYMPLLTEAAIQAGLIGAGSARAQQLRERWHSVALRNQFPAATAAAVGLITGAMPAQRALLAAQRNSEAGRLGGFGDILDAFNAWIVGGSPYVIDSVQESFIEAAAVYGILSAVVPGGGSQHVVDAMFDFMPAV
jgi:hypothetical protein